MARKDPDEPSEEEGSPESERGSPEPTRGRHRRRGRSAAGGGLTEWRDDADEDPSSRDPEEPPRRKRRGEEPEEAEPVYFRARDSVWFEPLVALMVIIVLLVALFAYTSNWPPMYVVESESMQHGYDDQLGLINTGDLVLAQKVDPGSIVPYVVGLQNGHSTYGEYGDVILYHPNGDTSVAPIIHRALIFLQYNPDGTYSAPELNGLACGNGGAGVYTNTEAANGCGDSGLSGGDLVLHGIGWQSARVDIPMDPSLLGTHSGFVTMGDNNFANGNSGDGIPDQVVGTLSTLVEPAWIVGVARGMIPWFGAVKLALDGNSGEVPPQSWQYLGITIVGIILAALALHLFLRSRGIEDPRRRQAEGEESEHAPPRRRGFLSRILHRGDPENPEDDGDGGGDGHAHHRKPHRPPEESHRAGRGGRPRPKVGRSAPEGEDEPDDDAD